MRERAPPRPRRSQKAAPPQASMSGELSLCTLARVAGREAPASGESVVSCVDLLTVSSKTEGTATNRKHTYPLTKRTPRSI